MPILLGVGKYFSKIPDQQDIRNEKKCVADTRLPGLAKPNQEIGSSNPQHFQMKLITNHRYTHPPAFAKCLWCCRQSSSATDAHPHASC